MSTTAIADAEEPSEIHSRRPAGSTVTWRASAPTSTRRTTRPRRRSMTATSPLPESVTKAYAAREGAVARLLESAQHPPHARRPALEQGHRAGRAVPDDRDTARAGLDAARPFDGVDPPHHPMAAERHRDDMRLGVGGRERERLARRHDRQPRALDERRRGEAGDEELAAVHRLLLRPRRAPRGPERISDGDLAAPTGMPPSAVAASSAGPTPLGRPSIQIALSIVGSVCGTLVSGAMGSSPTGQLFGAALGASIPTLITAVGPGHGLRAGAGVAVTALALLVTYGGATARDFATDSPATFPQLPGVPAPDAATAARRPSGPGRHAGQRRPARSARDAGSASPPACSPARPTTVRLR